MPIFSVTTLRSGFGDARSRLFTVVESRPTILGRIFAGALALVVTVPVLAVLLILLVPAVLLAVGAALAYSVRRALRGARQPNGVLDGRRNVRVITPDQP